MTDSTLDLATTEPVTADAVTSALRRVIDFQKTRGAMLRSLRLDPQSQQKDPSK